MLDGILATATSPLDRGVVIVGATSTMARGAANAFAAKGFDCVLAGRDEEELSYIAADIQVRHGVKTFPALFEARALDTHERFYRACHEKLGYGMMGVLVCFGAMEEQETVQRDFQAARRLIEANFIAAASVLSVFANHFEREQRGFIAAISSVAGDRGRQSNYVYGAAKAGLTVFLEGLRNRLYHAGVTVTTIKPGFVDTKMTYGMKLPFAATPEKAGRAICRAILKGRNVAYVPRVWEAIMQVIRLIPECVFKRMKL